MGSEWVDPHHGLRAVDLHVKDHRHRVPVNLLDVKHHSAYRTDHEPVAIDIHQSQLDMTHRTSKGAPVKSVLETVRNLCHQFADVTDHQWTSFIRISLATMIIFCISDAPS